MRYLMAFLILFIVSCNASITDYEEASFIISGGVYDGEQVEIDRQKALAGEGFIRRWHGKHYPRLTPSSLPFSVQFDAAFDDQDRYNFWNDVEKLESYLGFKAFSSESDHGDVILHYKFSESNSSAAPTMQGDRIVGGQVWIADRKHMSNGWTVPHELLHVLGVGHTCEWKTLMWEGACAEGILSFSPTVEDIAYFQYFILD